MHLLAHITCLCCDSKHLMKVTEHFRLLRYGHNGMERYQRTQSQSYAKITTCNHIAFKITRWISHFLQSSFSVNMHRSERIRSACFEMISIHLNLTWTMNDSLLVIKIPPYFRSATRRRAREDAPREEQGPRTFSQASTIRHRWSDDGNWGQYYAIPTTPYL